MPETSVTPILALPLLAPGQAQKEITHNEALTLLDAVIAGAALSAGVNPPVSAPQPGQCWLVGESPTGAWSDQARALAIWTAGGWRFAHMPEGSVVRVGSARTRYRRTAAGWVAPPHIAAPAGGNMIDSESRIALNQLIAALEIAGIISVT